MKKNPQKKWTQFYGNQLSQGNSSDLSWPNTFYVISDNKYTWSSGNSSGIWTFDKSSVSNNTFTIDWSFPALYDLESFNGTVNTGSGFGFFLDEIGLSRTLAESFEIVDVLRLGT